METILENSRNMLYKTLWQLDQGESVRTEAALLKRYATVGCTKVADMALEIFAALGYTTASASAASGPTCAATSWPAAPWRS